MTLELITRAGAREILKQLEGGAKRFSEITGLNKQTKGKRLVELEEAGLITRTVITERPVKVIYELTSKGKEVLGSLKNLEKKLD